MRTLVILAGLLVAACGYSSAPAGPSAPNFVVVSTDWRGTSVAPLTHGIFRNHGGGGSAVVTFSVVEMQTVYVAEPKPPNWPSNMGPKMRPVSSPQTFSCNTVVKAEAGQLAEASCPIPGISEPLSPPTATVSQ